MPDEPASATANAVFAPVGRSRERTLLRERLDAAFAGRGSLVLVGGEAGIGKTTLIEALSAEAQQRGALVIVGRCYDLTDTPPYGPWRELRTTYPVTADLPPLPSSFGTAASDGRDTGAASQDALFTQARDFLLAVAAARPLVLLLEDLHWADPASLDLLRFVGRQLAAHRLLILATYRADELTRRQPLYTLLPALVREAQAVRLDLRPLADDDLAALVAARYRLAAADTARLVAHLRTLTEGNPFYAGELLRTLEEEGTLAPAATGDWHLGELRVEKVPPLVQQVIDARLARLGDDALRLLGIAAVIGPVVPPDLWAAVAEAAEEALLDAIERAVEARVLVESPADGGYRFAHALIRGVLYQGMLLPRRRAWHRRSGEILAVAPSPDPDRVAHHFRQANDPRAAEWLIRAGEQAQASYAWTTAAERYETALALLEHQGAPPARRARLLHFLALLHRYKDQPRAIKLLAQSNALAAEASDAVLAAATRFDRGHLLCLIGDYGAGIPELRAALPLLEALPPEQLAALPTASVLGLYPGEAYHRGVLLLFLVQAGYLDEATALGAVALSLAPGTSYRALVAVGHLGLLRGDPTLSAQAYFAAGIAAYTAGQHREIAITLQIRANLLYYYRADDRTSLTALATEVAAALPAARAADPELTATEILSAICLIGGAWDDLVRWAIARPGYAPWVQALLARFRGETAQAWALVRAFMPDGHATPPGTRNLFMANLERVAAGLALDAGELTEARVWLEAHDRWLAWSGAVWGRAEGHLGWGEYQRAAGDLAAARTHAEAALAHATEPRQPLALLAARRLLGELDTTAAHHANAADHLDAALALAAACTTPYERALTLLSLTELRLATSDRAAAASALNEARALLEPLVARPALARADTLATILAAADAQPIAPPSLPAGLSAREAEVLRLVAQGLSNAQAAERLYLSPRTIDQHLRSIYNKAGVSSRAAATRFAIEHGLA